MFAASPLCSAESLRLSDSVSDFTRDAKSHADDETYWTVR
jgi:hypothetical protein